MKPSVLLLWFVCLPGVSLYNGNDYKKRGCDPSVRLRDLNDADYIIAGVFPCHLYRYIDRRYKIHYTAVSWVSAMLYALDEINRNQTILPGIKLGYDIRDSCNEIEVATKHTLSFMVDNSFYNSNNNSMLVGVIGAASSSISTVVNTMLSSEYIPEVSYASSSTELLSWKYQSFLRTVPSDRHQAAAIVDLIRSFGWTYISAFAVDDDYGRVGLEELQEVTKREGVCLALASTFSERLLNNEIDDIVYHMKEITKENTHVVILWAPFNLAKNIMRAAKVNNITKIVFIGTEIWGETKFGQEDFFGYRTIVLELGQPTLEDSFIKDMSRDLRLNWQNPWFREAFPPMFCPKFVLQSPNKPPGCRLPLTEQFAKVIVTDKRKKYPQVIAAVYAVAYGLHKYLKCDKWKCHKSQSGIVYKELFHDIRNSSFVVPGSKSYHVSFDKKALEIVDKEYLFKIYFNGTEINFGRWFGIRNITVSESKINWGPDGKPYGRCSVNCLPGSYRVNGSSECCWKCLPCLENSISTRINQYYCRQCDPVFEVGNHNKTKCIKLREVLITFDDYIGLLLLCSSVTGVLIILFIIAVFIRYWDTPVVKSSSREISIIQLLSLGLLFCLPALYFYKLTPLLCMFRNLVFGFLFTTVVSIILVKTYRLIRVFSERFTKVSRFLQNRYQILFIYLPVVFELIAVLLWNWNFPPYILRDVRQSELLFYITCDNKQTVMFWIVMLYIFILAIISGYYAFRARKLPENYNEAQYISLSMFTAIVIWVAYVPLFFSLSPHDNNIAFLFQNFVCTGAITVILYSYKVYVILFQPDLNSPEHARLQHQAHFMDNLHRDMWRRQTTLKEAEPFRPRLASLPIAVHPPSVFDEPDNVDGPKSPDRHFEKIRSSERVLPRRASFSSISELDKIYKLQKSYDSFKTDLMEVNRTMKKSQSTPFLLDEMSDEKHHHHHHQFPHFSFKRVLSNLSINKLLDNRKSETQHLLDGSSLDTKL